MHGVLAPRESAGNGIMVGFVCAGVPLPCLLPDSSLQCLLRAPRDKDLIARLRFPRKFPALASLQIPITHNFRSPALSVILIFLFAYCTLFIVFHTTSLYFCVHAFIYHHEDSIPCCIQCHVTINVV